MTAAEKWNLVSVEDYLEGELYAEQKHEYLGGVVYAMAGGRVSHHAIASNALGSLYAQLKGQRCRVFNSDMKVRVRLPFQTRFYYPDVSVICQSNAPADTFQDQPVVLLEVVSTSTRRTDEGEKKDAYLQVASLAVYLLVEQSAPVVVAYRRHESGFHREVYQGVAAVVPLPEIQATLALADLYEAVEFLPETSEE